MPKKPVVEKENVLWKDRKRYFGLPLSFTRYSVSNERLTIKAGFFKTVTEEILIYRIMDIKLTRKFGQKIFGVGTVTLISTDKTQPRLDLADIRHPDEVRRFLSKLIDEQRKKRGISGSEFLGMGRPGFGAHGDGHDGHIDGGEFGTGSFGDNSPGDGAPDDGRSG